MTDGYKISEVVDFLDWYSVLPFKHKIFIAGNHDRLFETNPTLTNSILSNYPDIIYLENSGCEIEGIKIWGTPDSKEFFNWAFNRTEEQMERIFSKIPLDTEILISHAPASGVGDMLERGEQVGEETLYQRIRLLENLKLHFFGHIHSSYDEYRLNNYKAYNCSIVNEQYQLENEPHIIDF